MTILPRKMGLQRCRGWFLVTRGHVLAACFPVEPCTPLTIERCVRLGVRFPLPLRRAIPSVSPGLVFPPGGGLRFYIFQNRKIDKTIFASCVYPKKQVIGVCSAPKTRTATCIHDTHSYGVRSPTLPARCKEHCGLSTVVLGGAARMLVSW